MSPITITVDPTAVEARLTRMGPAIREALRVAVERETITLEVLVKEKLSGPVLHTRTGRLRRSINHRVTSSDTQIAGSVGTNVVYARAHEMGFDGTVTVREHVRHIREAFGKSIAPRDVLVRSHAMHMHLPERSFLRRSLQERAPAIKDALVAAVRGVVQ